MQISLAEASFDPALRDFVLALREPVAVLDARARVLLANAAAVEALGAGLARLPAQAEQAFGRNGATRVRALLADGATGGEPLPVTLADGVLVRLALHRLERGDRWLLRVATPPPATTTAAAAGLPAAARALFEVFRQSPIPSVLQDGDYRIVDANEAFVEFSGRPRAALLGEDPAGFQPEPDRGLTLAARREAYGPDDALQPMPERRIVDPAGRERWFRAARRVLIDDGGRRLYLTVLQDCSAEHAAREQAERSQRDLEQWFDMSPLGMVLFDASGLVVRSNAAFESLIGGVPVMLGEAPQRVRQLLGWDDAGPHAGLVPGAAPSAFEAWAARPDGSPRRLRALVRAYETPGGHRRYMAAVQDLSAEEERDLARMQIGALMDTAGVGVATFHPAHWPDTGPGGAPVPPAPPAPLAAEAGAAPRRAAQVLQSIGRDVVVPESLPEYERLQRAMRLGQRIEARYAIRHPDVGLRWLLTRVEPGQLASGKRTTSVVTLDVTERQQAEARNVELAHDLGLVLEGSPAGIVHLREGRVLRCNQRFERMCGLLPGAAAGRLARELAAARPMAAKLVDEMMQALAAFQSYETEFRVPRDDGVVQWMALRARGFRGADGHADAIAVLSDVTRLKLQQVELERLARDRELMFSVAELGIAFLRDGRVHRANEALARLTGHPAERLAGLELATLFADEAEYRRHRAEVDAALARDGRWSGEHPLRRADGSRVWVHDSQRLVVDGDLGGGVIAGYVNVDDRRRAEALLVRQAESTRAVLDSVLVGIVTVGREGIVWMNRSARRMFGGALADFVGQPIDTVATPEAGHPFRCADALDTLAEGQAETFECRVKARDGREFWVAGNVVVTRHEGGARQLTYALLDIERRREAETRTAEAQAALQRIIDLAPLAIMVRDARSLRVLQANQGAGDMLGRAPETLIGCPPEDFHPAALAAAMRRDMETALVTGTLARHEYRLDVGGTVRIVDARFLPLAAPGAAPDQLLTVGTDITDQRAAEQARLDAANAQRDMLVREVHHRIKNNLQGVAGLMQQIAQRRPEVADVIAEVVGQVQAIAQVYGLQVGASGPLPLRRLVEAIGAAVERSSGREIRREIDGDAADGWALPEAEAIPVALTVNELLANALKHGGGAGPVVCRLAAGGDGVSIEVAGPGRLPPGFDLARVPGGVTGLGLVRALLPRRHARLTLEQRGEQVVATVALGPPGVLRAPLPA